MSPRLKKKSLSAEISTSSASYFIANDFSSKFVNKVRMSTLTTPNQHHSRNLSQYNKARKRNERNIDWKERNKTILTPSKKTIDMENPKKSTTTTKLS